MTEAANDLAKDGLPMRMRKGDTVTVRVHKGYGVDVTVLDERHRYGATDSVRVQHDTYFPDGLWVGRKLIKGAACASN